MQTIVDSATNVCRFLSSPESRYTRISSIQVRPDPQPLGHHSFDERRARISVSNVVEGEGSLWDAARFTGTCFVSIMEEGRIYSRRVGWELV
jgi:hypothetical protein